jgi:hypothetical protein
MVFYFWEIILFIFLYFEGDLESNGEYLGKSYVPIIKKGDFMTRIVQHPIVEREERSSITIYVDGKHMQAKEGEMIAAALLANGIDVFRYTKKHHEPRSIFCGIGQCNDCVMVVDGVPNTRTCVTPVRDGMIISTQNGLGKVGGHDGV